MENFLNETKFFQLNKSWESILTFKLILAANLPTFFASLPS